MILYMVWNGTIEDDILVLNQTVNTAIAIPCLSNFQQQIVAATEPPYNTAIAIPCLSNFQQQLSPYNTLQLEYN